MEALFDPAFNGLDLIVLAAFPFAAWAVFHPESMVRLMIRFLRPTSKVRAWFSRSRSWQDIEAAARPRLEELLADLEEIRRG